MFPRQELVSSDPNQRNWKGISIAVLVIGAVLALIVTSVVLLTPPDEGPRVRGQRVSLGDVIGGDLQPSRFNGTWISGASSPSPVAIGGLLTKLDNPYGRPWTPFNWRPASLK
jgi:hypothetical protein